MIFDVTSIPNLHAAFSRVEDSRGMAGVDGVTINAFKRKLDLNLQVLACELDEGRYVPFPLLRFLVAKHDGSPRVLAVPTVRDRVAQAAVLNIIGPLFKLILKKSVLRTARVDLSGMRHTALMNSEIMVTAMW